MSVVESDQEKPSAGDPAAAMADRNASSIARGPGGAGHAPQHRHRRFHAALRSGRIRLKRWLRSPGAQIAAASAVVAYLRLVMHTIRWRHENREAVEAVLAGPSGGIGCLWHGNIALSVGAKPVARNRDTRLLISLSRDGEFIARAMAALGLNAIRGSSGVEGRGRGAKDNAATFLQKRGAAGFLQALRHLRGGQLVVLTPDGPRGPAEVMTAGVVRLARHSGAPVFLIGLAARPSRRLNTWDRTVLPLPFGRGAVVWVGPLFVGEADDEEAIRLDWQDRLLAADSRAEALIA